MRRLGILLVLCTVLVGCSVVGPNTIGPDRFDYGNAIADSWRKEILLNLIRLRYGEAPMFMEVTSVINQYTLEGQLGAGASYLPLVDTDAGTLAGAASWADRPTITYAPVVGEALTRRLMKPLDPVVVLALTQSGWPVDFLFPLTTRGVNGLRNVSALMAFKGIGNAEYFRLVELMGEIQAGDAIGVRIEEREKEEAAVMFLTRPGAGSEAADAKIEAFRKLLSLDPGTTEYKLVYGSLPKHGNEIALLTKTPLEIMVELAAWIDVPAEHVEAGRARPVRQESEIGGYPIKAPLIVHHGSSAPDTAYASARIRDTWFWVDDGDFLSKRTFLFLQMMFSLAETGSKQLSPVITVGAGS